MAAHPEKALRIHLGLALAEALCVTAFVVELRRAVSGNTLSWAYVFEWPILGAYGVYVWWKLRRPDDERAVSEPTGEERVALDEYNRYLAEVHDRATPTDE